MKPRQFFYEVILPYTGDECLFWPFSTANNYGSISFVYKGKIKTGLVHRAVCAETYGPPPFPKAQAAHSCGKSLCCNPKHLRWATPSQNAKDRLIHGTDLRGEKHPLAKFTSKQVLELRSLLGSVSVDNLAKKYGVRPGTVRSIMDNETWFWLPQPVSFKASKDECSAEVEVVLSFEKDKPIRNDIKDAKKLVKDKVLEMLRD
jgi:HNH endonuclease